MFGLLAYPAQGIYKSIRALRGSEALHAMEVGRRSELETTSASELEYRQGVICEEFDKWTRNH